ncbi:hypothetical protein ISTM_325 [Insectomime virus]|uniref:Uncharacterized protein n=1 Tax=Tunisvirus fontaine2 TaxID=1421067 RepID=V9SHE6_9VIRU|nr:hypothetical protein D1R32_gp475 [Tunisvirus fontaine2]AHA46223.1 hypothetical protein ISTM_325 [Insectomime virus]AHC55192.1 hypothetical protein TNS_ORF474 [Tunisvirus fontaine2]
MRKPASILNKSEKKIFRKYFVMESQLISEVIDLIQKKFLLVKGRDYEIRCALRSNYSLWKTSRFEVATLKGKSLCYWYETKDEACAEHLFFDCVPPAFKKHFSRAISKLEMLRTLKRGMKASPNLSMMYRKKYKSSLKDVEELQSENARLLQENLELRYAPGGEGYLKAKEHFEQFIL